MTNDSRISVRALGDVQVVELPEEIAIGSGGLGHPLDLKGQRLADLSDTLRLLMEKGCRNLVLDLGRVSFMDSAGLGELVAWNKRLRQKGGDIRLIRPTKRVHDLFAMTGLTRVFRIFPDEAAAVASFAE